MNNETKAYLYLCLTMLFWAGNTVIARGVHELVPPIALSFARWTLATLFILPFAWPHLSRDWRSIKAHMPIVLLLGVTGVGAFNVLQYSALNHTTSINVLLLHSSAPLCIALLAFVIFSDRITTRQAFGIALSSLGVLIILAKGSLETLSDLNFSAGDLLSLAAVLAWAIYTIFLRKRPDIHFLSFAAATYAIGALSNIPLMFWEMNAGRILQPDMTTFLTIAYVSIFPSVIAYILYNKGVEYIGAARSGAFIHLTPVFGTILAIIFLNETPQAFHLVGFASILSGIWLTASPPK